MGGRILPRPGHNSTVGLAESLLAAIIAEQPRVLGSHPQGGGRIAPESAPQHMEHTCVDQGRRVGYQPPPFDQTPCHLNQKNCTKVFADTALGANVTFTYAWKHLIYEDFDRAVFMGWENNQTRPDYLFLSPGGHDCYHEPKVGAAHPSCVRTSSSLPASCTCRQRPAAPC